jgi:hypothetical protein
MEALLRMLLQEVKGLREDVRSLRSCTLGDSRDKTDEMKDAIDHRDYDAFVEAYESGTWSCSMYSPLTYFCSATSVNLEDTFEWNMMQWFLLGEFNFNALDPTGYAPLHRVKSESVADYLCNNGADPNLVSPTWGVRPLQTRLYNPDPLPTLKVLIEYGGDIYATGRDGTSCFSEMEPSLRDVVVAYVQECSRKAMGEDDSQ